jgi:hypothetical protein
MRLSANDWIAGMVSWIFIATLYPFGAVSARQNSQARARALEAPRLTCSADAPVVAEGKLVLLRAWALSPAAQSPREYNWTVDAGKISETGPEVRWDLTGVPASPQPHQATVKVGSPSGTGITCSVQVIVGEEERGTRTTGRSFLVKGQKEAAGYGLYSYLLLGTRPSDSSRDRYLAAIRAYLAGMEDVANLKDYIAPAKLNVAYLPIDVVAPANVTAEWLLEHYDYARARALLQALPGDLTDGPYIVSTLKPLSPDGVPGQYLFQNLSTVPTKPNDLVSWWVREFLHQAAQERFWEPKTAEQLVLKMRTTIAVLAIGLPDVQKAVGGWVSWIH